ncbi:hypothetical protein [Methylobacterium aerolatum]|uniref:Uncharacterized protein n=1 Tax=Methylobacterium aerolatum TaxID=418708 RepID=A0ABU0I5H7_9HYPH|nr:hypothetical protein [Methylobacterium aerolatum]MDQ0449871.1 hypothetical protein [Methylobacterium aerolatum]GJD36638.1 hypothetical protein FMGBMHLM_3561 [Methylobacterium aerolatum]
MFLDHEQRPIPPRWEPPGRKSAGRRGENAAITLILLISLLGFVTPVAGGTLVAMVMAIFGR